MSAPRPRALFAVLATGVLLLTAAPVVAGATGQTAAAAEQPAGDVKKGKRIAKRCGACHTFDKGGKTKTGPNLWGVVGRDVAAVPGFTYSDTLQQMGGVWSAERLDGFLAKPYKYAPGTKMSFGGLRKAKQRSDLIAYLHSLADSPGKVAQKGN